MYMYVYISLPICKLVQMHICTHANMYTCLFEYLYICKYIYTFKHDGIVSQPGLNIIFPPSLGLERCKEKAWDQWIVVRTHPAGTPKKILGEVFFLFFLMFVLRFLRSFVGGVERHGTVMPLFMHNDMGAFFKWWKNHLQTELGMYFQSLVIQTLGKISSKFFSFRSCGGYDGQLTKKPPNPTQPYRLISCLGNAVHIQCRLLFHNLCYIPQMEQNSILSALSKA